MGVDACLEFTYFWYTLVAIAREKSRSAANFQPQQSFPNQAIGNPVQVTWLPYTTLNKSTHLQSHTNASYTTTLRITSDIHKLSESISTSGKGKTIQCIVVSNINNERKRKRHFTEKVLDMKRRYIFEKKMDERYYSDAEVKQKT